jgi:hypothetical protein
LDEEQRAEQMASLKAQRLQTETARKSASGRVGLTKAQEAQKRKLDERRALVEAKRRKAFGGAEQLERAREEKRRIEADSFLSNLEKDLD